METQNLTQEELNALIGLLGKLDPKKPLGTALYDAVALVSISVAIEALTLRQGKNGLEIFLTKRSETDTAYPGMWHSPGTVLRSGEDFSACFARLEAREFKHKLAKWTFITINDLPDEARGHFLQLLYLCSMKGGGSKNWFPIDNLPQPIVPNHETVIIPIAVEAFRKLQAQ